MYSTAKIFLKIKNINALFFSHLFLQEHRPHRPVDGHWKFGSTFGLPIKIIRSFQCT